MWGMSRRRLRQCVDAGKVVEAIREAERASSGEVRVSVSRFFWGDVEKAAARAFSRLHMEATADRNGVLIFVVPSRRRFVVLGDAGIHAKVGQAFWNDVAACLTAQFARGAFTEGLVEGIHLVGVRLAEHFPWGGEADRNELPDDVDFR
ncbi:TPM domain-containing protein [Geothrix sp. 21YS21S-2]|uniref:TPM domain-containing protein n=1 Tax=Geothrix sp. 21YS21S-2 TaxID=3068893 RepID=UPI0027B99236|nr:TPM domain-containing protein [Geothrix sp. 21YS21S-2]